MMASRMIPSACRYSKDPSQWGVDQLPRFDFIVLMDFLGTMYGCYCAIVTFWQAQQDVTFPTFLKYAAFGLPLARAAVLATELYIMGPGIRRVLHSHSA